MADCYVGLAMRLQDSYSDAPEQMDDGAAIDKRHALQAAKETKRKS
jgi:hypothetical protein